MVRASAFVWLIFIMLISSAQANMPGTFVPVFSGLNNLTFITSDTVTGTTITIPSSTLPGDLIVLIDGPTTTGGAPSFVVPTNFTEIMRITGGTIGQIVSYKIAVMGDAGTTITGTSATGTTRKIIAVWRGNVAISKVSPLSLNNAAVTSNQPAGQTITSSNGPAPVLVLGAYRGGSSSITFDGTLTSTGTALSSLNPTAQTVVYRIMNVSPTNLTWGFTASSITNIMYQSFYLAVN